MSGMLRMFHQHTDISAYMFIPPLPSQSAGVQNSEKPDFSEKSGFLNTGKLSVE